MTLAEAANRRLGSTVENYGLRVVDKGPSLLYLVVSAVSLAELVFHPSEGGLNCRWYLYDHGAWKTLMVLDLLWERSPQQVPAAVLSTAQGTLDEEMAALAWKLEEAGADLLAGRVDWLREYEERVGTAEVVAGKRADELSSLGKLRATFPR